MSGPLCKRRGSWWHWTSAPSPASPTWDTRPPDSGNDAYGVIRFFAYRRGQRHVGDALLVAAESWMQGRGLKQSKVMPQPWRYPFYGFPHSYMSDHLDHIQALLRYRGFNKSGGEVFLDWLDMQPVKVSDSSGFNYELQVEDSPGAGRLPGLKVRAMKEDAQIGQCLLDSGAESSTADEAHGFAFCNILGVEESYQGSGLGLFLLAHAMCLAKEPAIDMGRSVPPTIMIEPFCFTAITVSASPTGPTNSLETSDSPQEQA